MDSATKEAARRRLAPSPEPTFRLPWRAAQELREAIAARARAGRPWLELLATLRSGIRAREILLVLIAALVGAGAGLATLAISLTAHALQVLVYGFNFRDRLSAIGHISLPQAFILAAGGLALGAATWLWTRRRPGTIVDPVEANALHGGRMSFRDSIFLSFQALLSNGLGASVGLEAAYAQMGAALGSRIGSALNLRRNDLRIFVGAGAGAGIAAAFGAPLTGAFYGFEIIIGAYTIGNIAPVVAAALGGAFVTGLVHYQPMSIRVVAIDSGRLLHYALYAGLGVVCAFLGVAIMRLVALVEGNVSRLPGPRWLKPAIGGLIVGLVAWRDPQALSAGHGALRLGLAANISIAALCFLILAKSAASILSLGFGFRGGLFFASLYLGSLVGKLFIAVLTAAGLDTGIDPVAASLVGMGALAVAIIGGPLTMSFLVLETTGDFGLTAVTLTASIISSLLVRELFGYSFSTWRLHLRGETIRSAHDVSWLRTLTAGRMMRSDVNTISASAPLEEFRRRFPLGSTRRVVALDQAGHYAGMVRVERIHADADRRGLVGEQVDNPTRTLKPEMTIKEIMGMFDRTEADELAVTDDRGDVIGVLSEAYATRRYADELERARRDLIGAE
ncbi:MAG TPA: chloride channel protein [Caulobacteraceae bacterium]|nr:chloride channel protein [Caulobacteraceae bacterium]